jgi:hypothetical protein
MKTVKFILKRPDSSELGYEAIVAVVPVNQLKSYCSQRRAEGWSLREIKR